MGDVTSCSRAISNYLSPLTTSIKRIEDVESDMKRGGSDLDDGRTKIKKKVIWMRESGKSVVIEGKGKRRRSSLLFIYWRSSESVAASLGIWPGLDW